MYTNFTLLIVRKYCMSFSVVSHNKQTIIDMTIKCSVQWISMFWWIFRTQYHSVWLCIIIQKSLHNFLKFKWVKVLFEWLSIKNDFKIYCTKRIRLKRFCRQLKLLQFSQWKYDCKRIIGNQHVSLTKKNRISETVTVFLAIFNVTTLNCSIYNIPQFYLYWDSVKIIEKYFKWLLNDVYGDFIEFVLYSTCLWIQIENPSENGLNSFGKNDRRIIHIDFNFFFQHSIHLILLEANESFIASCLEKSWIFIDRINEKMKILLK